MPYLHIQISGQRDAALAASVAQRGAELTARLLGKDPAATAVVIDFIDPALWFVAGAPLHESRVRSYHWMVSVTDETNTKAEKAAYLDAVHRSMGELLSGAAEHSYAHVADLRASAYGYGGRTQERRYHQAA